MRVAVVGATGLVGQKMLQVLAERQFPITELIPIASENSAGNQLEWQGKMWTIFTLQQGLEKLPQLALFSAGGETSIEWAPKFAERNCVVIDNSSAWRMNANVPLVVPEINMHAIGTQNKTI